MLISPTQPQQFGINRSTKNVLQQVHPFLQTSKLRKISGDKTMEQRLIQLDEVQVSKKTHLKLYFYAHLCFPRCFFIEQKAFYKIQVWRIVL